MIANLVANQNLLYELGVAGATEALIGTVQMAATMTTSPGMASAACVAIARLNDECIPRQRLFREAGLPPTLVTLATSSLAASSSAVAASVCLSFAHDLLSRLLVLRGSRSAKRSAAPSVTTMRETHSGRQASCARLGCSLRPIPSPIPLKQSRLPARW